MRIKRPPRGGREVRVAAARRLLVVLAAIGVLSVWSGAALADQPDQGVTVRVHGGSAAGSAGTATPASTTSVNGDTRVPVPAREGPAPAAAPPAPPAPSAGEQIVQFALQYQGYPYVWAGNTPDGFDCSGFTEFVILNVLGRDIGHGLADQAGAGGWIDWGAWQPGDLVFFQDTYEPGLSHVGIYVGDGRFIHAQNEETGVVITDVGSDYYSAHYYGAIRLV